MRIGVIQASSQKDKNDLLYQMSCKASAKLGAQVINFGVFGDETESWSYVETAALISLLLSSGSLDFVVTGCSSGQGMMLACNQLPAVYCGYVPTPQDAFLFGRINGGNAASLPLGLNYGWCGEINLQCTLEHLFCEPIGRGYPPEDAERKRRDAAMVRSIGGIVRRPWSEIIAQMDAGFVEKIFLRTCVMEHIVKLGEDQALIDMIQTYRTRFAWPGGSESR